MESRFDRESLRDDLRRSVEAVGNELTNLLAAPISDLTRELGDMPQHLTSVPGATIVSGIAEAVLTLLRSDDAAAAAWRDVVAAFEGDLPADECELRVAELRALMIERGHDWDGRVRHWTEILCDDALAVARARGETPHDKDPLTKAGLALADRLTLCESASREQPPKGAVVVWLAYSNASLRSTHLAMNGIDLFDGELWDDEKVLIEGSWDRPPELDDPNRLHLDQRPAEDFVLLRVDLGHSPIMTARARARQIAESLPALVAASSGWRLMDGEVSYVEGWGWFGSVWFEDPLERAIRLAQSPRWDPTGLLLPEAGPKLLRDLLHAVPRASAVADGFRWRAAVRQLPDSAQRVVLTVQAVERQFSPAERDGSTRWEALLARYYKALWAWNVFQSELIDAGLYGVEAIDDKSGDDYVRLHRGLVTRSRDGAIHVDREATVRNASEVASHHEPGSLMRRLLAEVEHYALSSTHALTRLTQLEGRFDILLARATRVRNTIIHGGYTVASLPDSVDRFVADLEGFVLGARLYEIEEDTPMAAIMQRWRVNGLDWRRRLEAGEDLADVVSDE